MEDDVMGADEVGNFDIDILSQNSELNEDELDKLVQNAVPPSTTRSTKWGVSVFTEWCVKRSIHVEFHSITASQLNDILRKFYGEVKSKKGSVYGPSALTGIRAAIQRNLAMPPFNRGLNIIADKEFIPANKMFAAKCKQYISLGNARPKHKDVISDEDMITLGQYFKGYTNDPCTLQDYVWFSLCYYFGKRGREGWRDTRVDSYVVKEENGETFVVENITQTSKNWQGGNKQADLDYSDNRMGNKEAVDAFQLFLEKRNQNITALFQTPLKFSGKEWFKREPLGKNKLANMMKDISKRAQLQKVYTSHCVRASTITRLFQAGVPAKQISALTRHKNESSLNHYISGMSTKQKRECGNILHSALNFSEAPIQVRKKIKKMGRFIFYGIEISNLEGFYKNCWFL